MLKALYSNGETEALREPVMSRQHPTALDQVLQS